MWMHVIFHFMGGVACSTTKVANLLDFSGMICYFKEVHGPFGIMLLKISNLKPGFMAGVLSHHKTPAKLLSKPRKSY